MSDFQPTQEEIELLKGLREFRSESINAVTFATFKKWSGESLTMVHKRSSSDPSGWWERVK